jgi:predicted metallopeptidase
MKRSSKKVEWVKAPDIDKVVAQLVNRIDIDWIDIDRVVCFRSNNSRARAYARIWGMPKILQMAADIEPVYALEILSEKFDHLSKKQKEEILLHELAHIPRTFSGSLVPHTRRRKGSFHDKLKAFLRANKRKSSFRA